MQGKVTVSDGTVIPMDDIIDVIRETVDVLDIMKPVYNFKA